MVLSESTISDNVTGGVAGGAVGLSILVLFFIVLLLCLVYKIRHKRTKKLNWLPNDLNRLESLNYTYGKIILILNTFFWWH